MSKILCIDIGNSKTKTCLFDNDNAAFCEIVPTGENDSHILSIVSEHQPDGIIISSVANLNSNLVMQLDEQVKYVHLMNEQTHLPIMNAYGSPHSLGTDRIAIAVGAQALYPDKNVLAISLGTCITYNFIQKNKAFRGGAISPGMHMRLKAMYEFTDKLPLVQPEGDLLLLGFDTETSIRSGAINGMAAEIDGMLAAFKEQYPDFNAVLTGGDGDIFAKKLKSEIFADPDLLMKGLYLIMKHNVPQLQ